MAELLPIGTTALTSAEFVVTAGAAKSLYIKSTANGRKDGVTFMLEYKKSDATFENIAALDSNNILQLGNIVGAGTFRVTRVASVLNAAGMDIE